MRTFSTFIEVEVEIDYDIVDGVEETSTQYGTDPHIEVNDIRVDTKLSPTVKEQLRDEIETYLRAQQ